MKKIFIGIALVISNFTLKSQILNDYIIKLNNDTIKCNITYIDDYYIFYNYFNSKLKYKKTYIQLQDVKSYEIKDTTKIDLPLIDTTIYSPITKFVSFGVGEGLNYGGLGGCITMSYEIPEIFFGAGYNFLEAGYNIGLLLRMRPSKKFCPYIGVMYGYNAVIKIKYTDQNSGNYFENTYYGPSFCLGFEAFTKKRNKYFNFTFILPVRSSEFQDDLYDIQNDPNIVMNNMLLPFTISVGFHFLIDYKKIDNFL